MVIQLDKITNSSVPMQATQTTPARLPKGLSEAPTTLNFAPPQKTSNSFIDSVRAFIASIWNFLCCRCRKESSSTNTESAAKDKEAFREQAVKTVANTINAHLSETSLKCLTQSQARISVVLFVNHNQLVETHYALVPRDKVADFRKEAIAKMAKALSTYDLKGRNVVSVHTNALEKSAGDGFNISSWNDSSILSTSTPYETISQSSGGVSSGDGIDAKTAESIIMTGCENNYEHPKAKALLKFFGEGLKS